MGATRKARAHLDALGAAGLHVGAYGFARFSQGSPRDQAKLAYEAATSDGKHVVRVALDLENCPKGTPWAALTDFAEEYLSELRLTGGEPLLYTMESWVGPLGAAAMGVPVWIAQYRSVTAPGADGRAGAEEARGGRGSSGNTRETRATASRASPWTATGTCSAATSQPFGTGSDFPP